MGLREVSGLGVCVLVSVFIGSGSCLLRCLCSKVREISGSGSGSRCCWQTRLFVDIFEFPLENEKKNELRIMSRSQYSVPVAC